MASIYPKHKFNYQGHVWIQIGIDSLEHDAFMYLRAIFRRHPAFFIPSEKAWLIREDYWPDLVEEVRERLDKPLERIRKIKEDLAEKVRIKRQEEESRSFSTKAAYGEEFSELKHLLINRQNHCCAICGCYANTCHHIIPVSLGGKTEIDNLIVLCSSCHAQLHALYRKRALKVALESNPNFFRDCLKEMQQDYAHPPFDEEKETPENV